MSETWSEIKAQIEAQVAAIKFMDKWGVEAYHKYNRTQFRDLRNVKYVPLNGVNVNSLWASADAEIESAVEKKKNAQDNECKKLVK